MAGQSSRVPVPLGRVERWGEQTNVHSSAVRHGRDTSLNSPGADPERDVASIHRSIPEASQRSSSTVVTYPEGRCTGVYGAVVART